MASLYIITGCVFIILLIIAGAKARFTAQADVECSLLASERFQDEVIVNESMMQHLPPLVKR